MATPKIDKVTDRIRRIALQGARHPDERSLLHAYIACLSSAQLCQTIGETLADPSNLRLALRGRLLRLLRDGDFQEQDRGRLHELVERSAAVGGERPKIRPFVDALLSAVIEYLDAPQQHAIIEAWIDRGTRGGAARWLKAIKQVPALFDEAAVMAYLRSSGDDRAAKSLAYQASPAFLQANFPEFLSRCDVGWIISKAALRAQHIDEDAWSVIRSGHPATYLYLCSKLQRAISHPEALRLVLASHNSSTESRRGLAIWAVGHMGMVEVLDEILVRGEELQELDTREYNRFMCEGK
jgi:hypothetical protein